MHSEILKVLKHSLNSRSSAPKLVELLSNGPILSKSQLSQRNNQDGDLVCSKCIQTLDGQCYAELSYIAGGRLSLFANPIKKLRAHFFPIAAIVVDVRLRR